MSWKYSLKDYDRDREIRDCINAQCEAILEDALATDDDNSRKSKFQKARSLREQLLEESSNGWEEFETWDEVRAVIIDRWPDGLCDEGWPKEPMHLCYDGPKDCEAQVKRIWRNDEETYCCGFVERYRPWEESDAVENYVNVLNLPEADQ